MSSSIVCQTTWLHVSIAVELFGNILPLGCLHHFFLVPRHYLQFSIPTLRMTPNLCSRCSFEASMYSLRLVNQPLTPPKKKAWTIGFPCISGGVPVWGGGSVGWLAIISFRMLYTNFKVCLPVLPVEKKLKVKRESCVLPPEKVQAIR